MNDCLCLIWDVHFETTAAAMGRGCFIDTGLRTNQRFRKGNEPFRSHRKWQIFLDVRECGDCCVFETQKWQFNYLCLTWRWKGSESLWEHVYIYSGFFSFKWSYESRECSPFWQAQHFLNLRTPHMDPLKSNMIILCVHNTIRFTEFKWCCFYQSAFKV